MSWQCTDQYEMLVSAHRYLHGSLAVKTMNTTRSNASGFCSYKRVHFIRTCWTLICLTCMGKIFHAFFEKRNQINIGYSRCSSSQNLIFCCVFQGQLVLQSCCYVCRPLTATTHWWPSHCWPWGCRWLVVCTAAFPSMCWTFLQYMGARS